MFSLLFSLPAAVTERESDDGTITDVMDNKVGWWHLCISLIPWAILRITISLPKKYLNALNLASVKTATIPWCPTYPTLNNSWDFKLSSFVFDTSFQHSHLIKQVSFHFRRLLKLLLITPFFPPRIRYIVQLHNTPSDCVTLKRARPFTFIQRPPLLVVRTTNKQKKTRKKNGGACHSKSYNSICDLAHHKWNPWEEQTRATFLFHM